MTSPLPKAQSEQVAKQATKQASGHKVPPQSLGRIFMVPLIIAALGLTGLILGLTGDGWRDNIAWALVGLPILFFVRDWRNRA